MPKKETQLFYKYLDKCTNYFEYGSGGSTYQACLRNNIEKIYTIESDKEWIEKLIENKIIKNKIDNNLLKIIYIDMDTRSKSWGYPGKNSKYNDWKNYVRSIDKIKEKIDLILIDGRFRVACALYCFDKIIENTLIIFDDFLIRKYYKEVLLYYDIIESEGRLAVLKKKNNIDSPSEKLIIKYENDFR